MANNTIRLTMAQALVKYISRQYVSRDGSENQFFAGMWGIFGHGNVAGLGQALEQYAPELRYYQSRNEQAQVLASVAYAKHKQPTLAAFACASSIGPGATNMITGAAVATVNRIPVLLLPGDIFAERIQAPVLAAVGKRAQSSHQRQRLLQAGLALLGSHLSAGAVDHGASGSAACAHLACRYRCRHLGVAARCAGGSA